MISMFHRSFFRVFFGLAAFGLLVGGLCAQQEDQHKPRKFKEPPPAARIEITVVRDYNGKPIAQAHVIFHPIEGDRDKGSLEVKTNDEGKAFVNVIPIGDTIRLQIIAKGFQTYGGDFVVDKEDISKEIRLKRPSGQYSVYTSPTANSSTGGSSGAGTSSGSGSGTSSSPDASKPTPPQPESH